MASKTLPMLVLLLTAGFASGAAVPLTAAAIAGDVSKMAEARGISDIAADGAAAALTDDPAAPLIDELRAVSTRLRASPYANSSVVARQNTERYLSGLFAQAWDFAGQLNLIGAPFFARGADLIAV